MTRIWLLLLLALSLTPSAASASWSAPVGEPDRIQADDARYGSHALRSAFGLDLVWRTEPHGPGGASGGSRHRSGDGSPDSCVPSGGSILRLARARLLAGPRSADVDGAVAPLCERLPYFATAPPSPR